MASVRDATKGNATRADGSTRPVILAQTQAYVIGNANISVSSLRDDLLYAAEENDDFQLRRAHQGKINENMVCIGLYHSIQSLISFE
jgi:hypothetical protein